jgi:DHA1 family bicyclomycin/chloramphenicol resistance-like MFS transporter
MPPDPKTAISRVELIALLAMLMATVAFSIDAMLPVLPGIADALSPDAPNRAQLVIATFVVGMGLGTLIAGPLSDAYGRRPIAVAGAVIYIVGALLAAIAPTLEMMLAARTLQGLGAAGPRIVALALTRDLFSGREMARIVSFVMIVFTLVPVIAPTMGAAIAWAFGWRAIFVSFAIFSIISMAWLMLRQPETLAPERRRPFRAHELWAGATEVARNAQVMWSIAVQTLIYAMLFIALMSSQQIFDLTFDRGDSFPIWFGAIAAISASASLLNAFVVVRLGMRLVVRWALTGLFAITLIFVFTLTMLDLPPGAAFGMYVIWQTAVFYMAGLGIGNMNALAMEPMGHIAGMAASIISASATVLSVALAAPISLSFDGTPLPAALGILIGTVLAMLFIAKLRDTGPQTDPEPNPGTG